MDLPSRNLISKTAREETIEAEIYFLISKFLSLGPCSRAAQVIREEIEENHLLPLAYSWTGEQRRLTLSQLERNYPHIRNDHLIKICSRIGPILDSTIPPSVPGVNSLLGAGTTSLLRNSSVIKSSNSSHALYRRHHGVPLLPSTNKAASNLGNIVNILSARESSGSLSVNRTLPTSMYNKQQMHKRYLGHLSSVYCVAFDRTGKYIFTGADDSLVKIWSAISGRLLATLRGHSAEITDLAVNFENTLLASGSCDKIIRVWSLRTTEPVTILAGHTATITSLKFCPYSVTDDRYLMSTSNDGSVNIWYWNAETNLFKAQPIKFVEKRQKQNAQILCSSFSPGGSFLAIGSTDHFVRVYHLSPPSGPVRILELEVNSDQVDSIQFSNYGLRFISGSKDGTAHIWEFRRQCWNRRLLDMSEVLQPAPSNSENDGKPNKIKVNMVCWTCDDAYVITAVNDRSIKVWDSSTGKLKHVLNEHEDEVFVLEANPVDGRIFLSGGHDGKIIIWDVNLGSSVAVFCNQIEGQGAGAIFDCKFSPDGQLIASTDSHGHLAIYGYGIKDRYDRVPNDVFFHTDYRPLIRDADHYVIDEQTQRAPHLMPPPFLVDIDGNPYPPNLQRLVPGRENCKEDQLVPYVAIQNELGIGEVLQPLNFGQEIPRPVPQPIVPVEPAQNGNQVRLIRPHRAPTPPLLPAQPQPQVRPTIDDMIERLAQEQARERVNVEHGYAAPSSVSGDEQGAQRARSMSQSLHQGPGPSALRDGPRVGQEGLGVRQPGANWQSRDKMSAIPLGGRVVVENLRPATLASTINAYRRVGTRENELYDEENAKKKIPEISKPEPTKAKEAVKPKKKRVVRRNADAQYSALSQNRGDSVSNDLENVEDLVSMDESDDNYSDSNASWTQSSTGESDSDNDEEEDDDDDEDEDEDEESGVDDRSREIVTRSLRARSRRKKHRTESWKSTCLQLVEDMFRLDDSAPFRCPVDEVEYADYRTYVDTPMDLSTIKEELGSGNYRDISDFTKDMETIFSNSKKYNTDRKSAIYVMTHRLRSWFRERMKNIGGRSSCRSRRATVTPTIDTNEKRYTLRNKRKRKGNARYEEDYITTTYKKKKRTKLKRRNGERTKESRKGTSSCSSRASPSTSFDPNQPSTSGLSSRATSQSCTKKGKKIRRRVIRNSSPDDDETIENEPSASASASIAGSASTSGVNGLSNGGDKSTFYKSLILSDDEATDVEGASNQTNGLDNHSGSATEIDEDKADTDATEIAGDDDTQDAVINGPCESKPLKPRKRRKVRRNGQGSNKRFKSVKSPVNGEARLTTNRRTSHINNITRPKIEPESEDEGFYIQAAVADIITSRKVDEDALSTTGVKVKRETGRSGIEGKGENNNEDDICTACNSNAPPGSKMDMVTMNWIACDSCNDWYHYECVDLRPGFNDKKDSFYCSPCEKGGRRKKKSSR